ncbi:MAG: glycosyltransferase family 39 protein [Phycisphaerae bacterium]|nr:glycosyltransferase family 39 protein [Phycisphaerae bacterium]
MPSKKNAADVHVALQPARPPGTSLGLLIVVMVVIIAPLIALSQVIAYWRVDVVDDQMFGYYGWRIAHGATVYQDVWDNKPPAIYWVNALGFLVGLDSYYGVIALCVAALVIAHTAFFVVCATNFHRGAAALATIFLSFFLTHAYYTGGTNRTETFLVACELSAVAFYMRGWARDRWWTWYVAGLLCGLAFLFKQVGLAAWGCMGLHLIVLMALRQLPVAVGLKRGVLLVAGAGTTVGVAAAVLAAQGVLSEACFATFGFNRLYFASGDSRFPYNIVTWSLLSEHTKPILLLPLLMGLAAVIHAFLWWLRPQHRPPEIEAPLRAIGPACPLPMFLFTTWFFVAFYGALVSPAGFRHYLVPTIPPLLLMNAYLINVLRAESHLLHRFQQRAWVLVAFVIMGYFAQDAVKLQFEEVSKVWVPRIDPWLTGEGRYEAAHWEVVGDAVKRFTRPGDEIYCWGYMPGVYLEARRISACRFTTTEKVGQVGALFILHEIEATLRAHPPAVLTIKAEEYEWLHGRLVDKTPSDSKLGPWIDEEYYLVEEIPKFETVYVFQRKDLADPATTQPLPSQRGS